MAHTRSYHEVREALSLPGCPICRLNAAAAQRYLDGLLWELVNDYGVRARIRKARGFCNLHAWLLARQQSPALGVSIIMKDVLDTLLAATASSPMNGALARRRLRETLGVERAAPGRPAAVRLEGEEECPACAHVRQLETIYLRTLAGNLIGESSLEPLYRASDGLCLPHFRQCLLSVSDEEAVQALLNAQRAVWERLSAQLGEFIRKNDYRFRDEPFGEEGDAWMRSLGALSGENPCLTPFRDTRSRPVPANSDGLPVESNLSEP